MCSEEASNRQRAGVAVSGGDELGECVEEVLEAVERPAWLDGSRHRAAAATAAACRRRTLRGVVQKLTQLVDGRAAALRRELI